MIRKIFDVNIKRNSPIAYKEFKQIGMSENGYLSYLQFCDEFRAALILYAKCNDFIPTKLSKAKKADELQNICKLTLGEIIELLQKFCNEDLNLFDTVESKFPIEAIVRIYIRFDGSTDYLLGIDEVSPYLLFIDFDRFRIFFEYLLSKLICGEQPILWHPPVDDPYSGMCINELQVLMEQKNDYEYHDNAPEFPSENGESKVIYRWAEVAERYYQHQRFIEEYEDLENYIEDKKKSIFNNKYHTLYVHTGNIICLAKNHSIKSVVAEIACGISQSDKINIDVMYCEDCNKFFINETSYNRYMDKYKFLPIIFRYVNERGEYPSYCDKAEKSPLMLCGYNVNKNSNYSDKERQLILTEIINSGIMHKYEVINYLINFIDYNGRKSNMEGAIDKWKSDLDFIHSYNIDLQDKVLIDKIEPYKR